jgi:hypothetical protein
MEEKTQARKGHFWLGLSVGLLIGILLACAFYFLDKYTSLEMLRFQRANTESAVTDTVVQIVESPARPKKAPAKTDTLAADPAAPNPTDTLVTEATDEEDIDTDDLMMDLDDDNVKTVAKAKGIASRRVRVINICSLKGFEPEYESFDVEQWSEPVKNRISYQRNGNILKIKGIDIRTIEIDWTGENYILRQNGWGENGHTYAIPENKEFTRLTE